MVDQASDMAQPRSTFLRGLAVQAHVIGALIMRELHTRYGRENIGYLWMVLEPMTLAAAVSSLHLFQKSTVYGSDIQPVPFTICGYCVFIIFRQIVSRSEGGDRVQRALALSPHGQRVGHGDRPHPA